MLYNIPYPNLGLIAYKVELALSQSETFMKVFKKEKGFELEIVGVFPQVWGSTCTGFDVLPNGEPAIGGCAMTKEYTTVVHEVITDIYVVCFGNRVAYMVDNPTETFFEDLRQRNMASLRFSKEKY